MADDAKEKVHDALQELTGANNKEAVDAVIGAASILARQTVMLDTLDKFDGKGDLIDFLKSNAARFC